MSENDFDFSEFPVNYQSSVLIGRNATQSDHSVFSTRSVMKLSLALILLLKIFSCQSARGIQEIRMKRALEGSEESFSALRSYLSSITARIPHQTFFLCDDKSESSDLANNLLNSASQLTATFEVRSVSDVIASDSGQSKSFILFCGSSNRAIDLVNNISFGTIGNLRLLTLVATKPL